VVEARSAVLRAIALHGPISRADLARLLGLSGPTVTLVTKDLLAQGIVHEVDRAPSSGGRPATLLRLVSSAAVAVGVKLAPNRITGVHVDLAGEVVLRFDAPIRGTGAAAIAELITCLRANLPAGDVPLIGIGVGLPGVVAPGADGVTSSSLMHWDDVPLAATLSAALNAPVVLDNDVNTLAVAETLVVRSPQVTDFLVVTIGRGVGLGIVAHDSVYRGAMGAGEFGHIVIDPQGPVCECGNRGCLEAHIGDPALLRQARALGLLDEQSDINALQALADAGDAQSAGIFAGAARLLGQHVANLVNILGPALVLVSGEGSRRWHLWRDAFELAFRTSLTRPFASVRVELDPWDDDRWAQGAASLVLRAGLAPQRHDSPQDELIRERLITSRPMR
jgi:predicted NBD/HSP70 family sugar kinase